MYDREPPSIEPPPIEPPATIRLSVALWRVARLLHPLWVARWLATNYDGWLDCSPPRLPNRVPMPSVGRCTKPLGAAQASWRLGRTTWRLKYRWWLWLPYSQQVKKQLKQVTALIFGRLIMKIKICSWLRWSQSRWRTTWTRHIYFIFNRRYSTFIVRRFISGKRELIHRPIDIQVIWQQFVRHPYQIAQLFITPPDSFIIKVKG